MDDKVNDNFNMRKKRTNEQTYQSYTVIIDKNDEIDDGKEKAVFVDGNEKDETYRGMKRWNSVRSPRLIC